MPADLATPIQAEFKQEAAITRRLLERLPEERLHWKPHDKSMTLGSLVSHIAGLPQWAAAILENEETDLANRDFKPVSGGSRQEVLTAFDRHVAAFEAALAGHGDPHLLAVWRLRAGDRVVAELRRIAALRAFVVSHMVHHRGQLSVYLRLLDVPLPQIYGPSADDRSGYA